MSEEEKKAIERIVEVRNKHIHTFVDELTIVLNLIEKQNNKLEQLEEENEELRRLDRTRVIGHINAIKIEDLKDVLSPYYIPKSVIREKIEDLDNYDSEFSQRVSNHSEITLTEFVQNILKELLEGN